MSASSPLLWFFSSVLVNTGSMKQYLKYIQVAQVVQLLQDGIPVYTV